MTRCTVCASSQVNLLGSLKPYYDYCAEIYECLDCESYFTQRDEDIYENLHKSRHSSYSQHSVLAQEVLGYFHSADINKLQAHVSESIVHSFIFNSINNQKNAEKILELGCSKGHFGSYFILSGYKYSGVDISPTAVAEATAHFGDHFFCATDSTVNQNAPYDVIYHVGTIGCVESPIDFIKYNLSLLRKGGLLLFNAPNVNACKRFKELWVSQTTPPDLVTLFHPDVWKSQFNELAEVDVTITPERTPAALKKIWKKIKLGTTLLPPKQSIYSPMTVAKNSATDVNNRDSPITQAIKKTVLKVAKPLLGNSIPAEFGVLVAMRKR